MINLSKLFQFLAWQLSFSVKAINDNLYKQYYRIIIPFPVISSEHATRH